MSTKNFLILIALLVAILAGYYSYLNFLKRDNSIKETLVSPQTDTTSDKLAMKTQYTLPSGEQLYNVSHGEEVAGPKMSQVVYSPLAFESGQTQKIKIVFPDKEVVGSVVLFITTDNKENQKVVLKKELKVNTWVGEWTPEDAIKTRYSVKIVAVGSAGEYNNTMYFL